jgi:hypothetical protein
MSTHHHHYLLYTHTPLQVLPELQAALQTCQFYSFDCEMSGLYPPGCEDYPTDDVDDRYLKTAAAAEDFIVTQMGLSLFTWTGSHYEARSFNFHLFPSPSDEMDLRFSCQASSLAFLAGHGFDFNKVSVVLGGGLWKGGQGVWGRGEVQVRVGGWVGGWGALEGGRLGKMPVYHKVLLQGGLWEHWWAKPNLEQPLKPTLCLE